MANSIAWQTGYAGEVTIDYADTRINNKATQLNVKIIPSLIKDSCPIRTFIEIMT